MPEIQVTCRSLEETDALGRRLAEELAPGDRVDLRGDLGAGKTTFTRALVAGLGHPDPREVASPTYALHHLYEGGRLVVHHLDLYRLGEDARLAEQGLLDPLEDGSAVVVVEWPERMPPSLPTATIRVDIEVPEESVRRFILRFTGSHAEERREAFGGRGAS